MLEQAPGIAPREDTDDRDVLMWVLAAVIGILFFTLGQFEFFDLLGIKRILQAVLVGSFFFLSVVLVSIRPRLLLKEPLLLVTVVFLAGDAIRRAGVVRLLDDLLAVAVVSVVLLLGTSLSTKTIKVIVTVAGFFALLALVQFLILTVNPSLRAFAMTENVNPNAGDPWTIGHPIVYLGLIVEAPRNTFGVELVRIHSFLREPSLLPVYFLLPAALALLVKGYTKLWVVPILAMSFLGFSASFYLPILLLAPLALLLILPILHRHPRAISILAVTGICVVLFLVYRTSFVDDLMMRMNQAMAPYEGLEFLNKWGSYDVRVTEVRQYLESRESAGPSGVARAAVGLILYGFFRGGVPGALLNAAFLSQLFYWTSKRYSLRRAGLLPIAFVAAIFLQAGVFNIYGFDRGSGFIVSALALSILRAGTAGEPRNDLDEQGLR